MIPFRRPFNTSLGPFEWTKSDKSACVLPIQNDIFATAPAAIVFIVHLNHPSGTLTSRHWHSIGTARVLSSVRSAAGNDISDLSKTQVEISAVEPKDYMETRAGPSHTSRDGPPTRDSTCSDPARSPAFAFPRIFAIFIYTRSPLQHHRREVLDRP